MSISAPSPSPTPCFNIPRGQYSCGKKEVEKRKEKRGNFSLSLSRGERKGGRHHFVKKKGGDGRVGVGWGGGEYILPVPPSIPNTRHPARRRTWGQDSAT